MTATISSTRNGSAPTTIVDSSRDDLRIGDVITLTSVDTHLTYLWSILYKPSDKENVVSTATLTAPTNQTTSFTVDKEGSYIINLLVDASLGTEDYSTLRLRAATVFANLLLSGAGEKKDVVSIPDDMDANGWANNQNRNILVLLDYISKVSSSGRVLYVDANRGTNYTEDQNDPEIAEGFGHYSTITEAIAAALADPEPPSETYPYLIHIRPGLYIEDFELPSSINLLGDSCGPGIAEDYSVVIQPANNTNPPIRFVGDNNLSITFCKGITFKNSEELSGYPLFHISGDGVLVFKDCGFLQRGDHLNQGPVLYTENNFTIIDNCVFLHQGTQPEHIVIQSDNSSYLEILNSKVYGPVALDLNSSMSENFYCEVSNTALGGTLPENTESLVKLHTGSMVFSNIFIEDVELGAGAYTIEINPEDNISTVNYSVNLQNCLSLGTLNFNNSNLTGNRILKISSSSYTNLSSTGSFSAGYPVPLTLSSTIFFDSSTSNYISSDNVQDSIDALDANLSSLATFSSNADEDIPLGRCVCKSDLGYVLANPLTSSGNTEVFGVSTESVLTGGTVRANILRTSVTLEFDVAPDPSDVGSIIYLAPSAGKVTLTPTITSGYDLVKVGVLLEASGVATLVPCLFDPKIIISIS